MTVRLNRYFLYQVRTQRSFRRRFFKYLACFISYLTIIVLAVYITHKLAMSTKPGQPQVVDLLQRWRSEKTDLCLGGGFVGYKHLFARLTNVVIDPSSFDGPNGGEEIKDVLNQAEDMEYYIIKPNAFSIVCDKHKVRVPYKFRIMNEKRQMPTVTHLDQYYAHTELLSNSEMTNIKPFPVFNDEFTIAVTRYEYTNFYHTMTDWYNVFLLMHFFNKTAESTNILIIDAHPKGMFDEDWGKLFNSCQRVSSLQHKSIYKDMVWNIVGYNSPIYHSSGLPFVPFIEEFRDFFLSRYKVSLNETVKDCGRLNIVIILRKNFVSHPRNAKGKVDRKFENENDILNKLKHTYPKFNITGIHIDQIPLGKRLSLVSKTDILIGMHGEGLTNALFLPKHAGMVEIYPSYGYTTNRHFRKLAEWRGLIYKYWKNTNLANEFIRKQTTFVPPDMVVNLVHDVLVDMSCVHRWRFY